MGSNRVSAYGKDCEHLRSGIRGIINDTKKPALDGAGCSIIRFQEEGYNIPEQSWDGCIRSPLQRGSFSSAPI